ncbi:hypothetical protein [Lentimicrobium sp. S6]|uniref:hypothetical protein n=1 Tax=Lentimicrobium sp. S6 TaxID=2735872 RepID=UPI00155710EA|nr:hypothetical protein [Lentimicrobium sp. S6]NPD43991.1 hypothetical protein [Lentimicrobium sp. S6]
MNIRKIRIRLVLTGIVVLVLFVINKEYLRPAFQNNEVVSIIVGSLPNFLGAYLFSLLPFERIIKSNNKNRKAYYYLYVAFIFIFLIIEEFFPFFTASKTFDVYDILASGMGCILAILSYEITIKKMLIKNQAS